MEGYKIVVLEELQRKQGNLTLLRAQMSSYLLGVIGQVRSQYGEDAVKRVHKEDWAEVELRGTTYLSLRRKIFVREDIPVEQEQAQAAFEDDEKIFLSKEEALSRLKVENGRVHTLRDSEVALVGADWALEDVEHYFNTYAIEETGPAAQAAGHGVACTDSLGTVFFETKNEVEV